MNIFNVQVVWDRPCHQAHHQQGLGRSSSTSGGRRWTWWGRWHGCTCQCHWHASQTGELVEMVVAWVSWFVWAVVGHVYHCTCGDPCQSCHVAMCLHHHWLYMSTCNMCGSAHRPENDHVNESVNLKPLLTDWPLCEILVQIFHCFWNCFFCYDILHFDDPHLHNQQLEAPFASPSPSSFPPWFSWVLHILKEVKVLTKQFKVDFIFSLNLLDLFFLNCILLSVYPTHAYSIRAAKTMKKQANR